MLCYTVRMSDRDYSHRSTVDKLGVRPGHRVAAVAIAGEGNPRLLEEVEERVGGALSGVDGPLDIALLWIDDGIDPVAVLLEWRLRLRPAGTLWLLTAKRGRPGYVNQDSLIATGRAAGMVDNKVCSVSDTTSAMRFVIRRGDRAE